MTSSSLHCRGASSIARLRGGLANRIRLSPNLTPREVLAHDGNDPFGQCTDLGWSIIGVTKPVEWDDIFGVSHHMIAEKSPAHGKETHGHSRLVLRSFKKEVFQPVHAPELPRWVSMRQQMVIQP